MIYVGIDDTDIVGSPGTNQLARKIVREEKLDLPEKNFGPFWNPPFYAWTFAPLSRLTFFEAVMRWTGVSVIALIGSLILLCRMLPADWKMAPQSLGWFSTGHDWRNWLLVPLLVVFSMPLIQSLSHGQNRTRVTLRI